MVKLVINSRTFQVLLASAKKQKSKFENQSCQKY